MSGSSDLGGVMSGSSDVAIIGAGPYGLSIAAHLRAKGIEHRIVGDPMQFWLGHMPRGMLLKSDGFASTLYDPKAEFTLSNIAKSTTSNTLILALRFGSRISAHMV